jgi:TolB-like protein
LRYLFEDCVFDSGRRELRRGTDVVSVAPQVFDILDHLIRNRERVVSKDDLIAAIWDGRIVSDAAVTTRINAARAAVGDSGEEQRLIKTLPRKGFRFIGTVREEQAPAPPSPADTPPAPPAPSLALPDKPSIAVLPFANLSGDPGQDYCTDGIVEDIITELSRFSELFVIARNSSFKYKGKAVDVRDVGRELGVRYVLEGSVRRGGDRIRITAQLIEASTGVHCWAERYDRKLEDVFAVQDEVVGTIVAILAVHVRKAETERSRSKPPNSWLAYEYYLQGVDCYVGTFGVSFRAEDLYEARRLFQESLAIDPRYAPSHAMLATSYGVAWCNPVDSDFLNPGTFDRYEQLARKAIRLDPNLPFARTVLAHALAFGRDYEASLIEVERALALNPNNPDWRLGLVLIFAGHASRAGGLLEACMRLDPFCHPMTGGVLGLAHYMLGQYAQALPLHRDFVARTKWPLARVLLAATYTQLNQLDAARAMAAELRQHPVYTLAATRKIIALKHAKDEARFLDALRKAGLPE